MVRAEIIATVVGSWVVNATVVIIIIVPGVVVVVCREKPGPFSKSISKTSSLRFNWRRNKHSQ